MAPKRKRGRDGELPVTAIATRSSTRQAAKPTTATSAPKASHKDALEDSEDDTPHSSKKTKRSRTRPGASTSTANAKSNGRSMEKDDVSGNGPNMIDKPTAAKRSSANLYSPACVQELFNAYADNDDSEIIRIENFGKLCADANIPMEGAMPLILFWFLGAKEFGNITREEWTKGMELVKISSLTVLHTFLVEIEALLLTDAPAKIKKKDDGKEPYDRSQYYAYAKNMQGSFDKLYMSSFLLVKTGHSRNIDMETALAFWSVLLAPRYIIMKEVISFINDHGSYKAVNKDVWSMMLEFCRTVNPNLDNYETDGAWPTLLDDFVSWKKNRDGDEVGKKTNDPEE